MGKKAVTVFLVLAGVVAASVAHAGVISFHARMGVYAEGTTGPTAIDEIETSTPLSLTHTVAEGGALSTASHDIVIMSSHATFQYDYFQALRQDFAKTAVLEIRLWFTLDEQMLYDVSGFSSGFTQDPSDEFRFRVNFDRESPSGPASDTPAEPVNAPSGRAKEAS